VSENRISTWKDAEVFALSILRAWGYPDAALSVGGADSGVDVRGQHVLAQVKFRSAPTGRPDIQRLFGARGHEAQDLYFFSASAYSPQAIEYAEAHDVGLFSFERDGTVTAHTRTAKAILPEADDVIVKLAESEEMPLRDAVVLGGVALVGLLGSIVWGIVSGAGAFGAGLFITILVFGSLASLGD
jgi:hypothetical protein